MIQKNKSSIIVDIVIMIGAKEEVGMWSNIGLEVVSYLCHFLSKA